MMAAGMGNFAERMGAGVPIVIQSSRRCTQMGTRGLILGIVCFCVTGHEAGSEGGGRENVHFAV
jgi:hypothetical protein